MHELIAYTFIQRAFMAGIMVGFICSLLSFFVVLKRLCFLGAGISHTAVSGIAIGLVLGVNPVATGSAVAVGTAIATGYLSQKTRVTEDTIIGTCYAAGMAFGIGVISMADGYHPELFSLLFGSLLTVSARDLWLMGLIVTAIAGFVARYFPKLLAICFDEEMARASGLQVDLLYVGLLASMGLAIMISVQLVGVVLVAALIVIPGATGYNLCRNYRGMLVVSIVLGIAGSILGIAISCVFPVPPGAAIVLVLTALFAVALVKHKIFNALMGLVCPSRVAKPRLK